MYSSYAVSLCLLVLCLWSLRFLNIIHWHIVMVWSLPVHLNLSSIQRYASIFLNIFKTVNHLLIANSSFLYFTGFYCDQKNWWKTRIVHVSFLFEASHSHKEAARGGEEGSPGRTDVRSVSGECRCVSWGDFWWRSGCHKINKDTVDISTVQPAPSGSWTIAASYTRLCRRKLFLHGRTNI